MIYPLLAAALYGFCLAIVDFYRFLKPLPRTFPKLDRNDRPDSPLGGTPVRVPPQSPLDGFNAAEANIEIDGGAVSLIP